MDLTFLGDVLIIISLWLSYTCQHSLFISTKMFVTFSDINHVNRPATLNMYPATYYPYGMVATITLSSRIKYVPFMVSYRLDNLQFVYCYFDHICHVCHAAWNAWMNDFTTVP